MNREEAKYFSDVLKAYSEGKSIEQQVAINKWEEVKDLTDNIAYEFAYPHCFRIKPEPKYRPYKNTEEFLNAQKEHGPFIKSCLGKTCAYYSIRVVHPGCEGITFSYAISAGDREVSYQQLLDEMYWQDGHPCGIVEEQ